MNSRLTFTPVCAIDDITPGTGVCALVGGRQVALFRPSVEHAVLAIDNMDPFAKANVLSRGLICEHDGELWVASPLKKQRFNLTSGQCMEDERFRVNAYPARVVEGVVNIAV